MNPRSMIALGVGGVAAIAAVVFGVTRQIGVKSYGQPIGKVMRAGQYFAVLMETRDPYLPSLKGRSENDMSYSYSLWLIPETCDGDIRSVRLDRNLASNARMHAPGVRAVQNGVVWVGIKDVRGIDAASGQAVSTAVPASIDNMPISQLLGSNDNPLEEYRAHDVTLSTGERFVLANDDELKSSFAAGTRLYDNSTAMGTYKSRSLQTITVQPGPIPRVATTARVGSTEFKNGAFMRSAQNASVVQFTNPDGFLIVHDGGDPVHPSARLSRVNIDGSIAWTADTKIGRISQVLPHENNPAFVGQAPQQLTEPLIAVVNLKDGSVKTNSLQGPLN